MITDQQVRRLRRLDRQGTAQRAWPRPRPAWMPRPHASTAGSASCPARSDAWTATGARAPTPSPRSGPNSRSSSSVNPGLEAKTLFADLQRRFPGRFADGQLRTLQRHVKQWRAVERTGQGGVLRPGAPPRSAGGQRLHPLHRPGRDHQRQSLRPPDLPLRADLLELGDGHDLLLRELREPQRGLAERLVGTGRRAATAPHRSADGGHAAGRRRAGVVHAALPGVAAALRLAGPGDPGGQGQRERRRRAEPPPVQAGVGPGADAAWQPRLRQPGRRTRRSCGSCSAQRNAGRRQRLAEEVPLLRPLPARRLEACKRLRVRVDRAARSTCRATPTRWPAG